MRYVNTGETRSGRREREERAKNAWLERRQDQRRKESSNSLDPLSRANINELKRVLSRPCHSGGWQNHPVDYEIMLLQKIKSVSDEERERDRVGKAREGEEGKIVEGKKEKYKKYKKTSPPLGSLGISKGNCNACEKGDRYIDARRIPKESLRKMKRRLR